MKLIILAAIALWEVLRWAAVWAARNAAARWRQVKQVAADLFLGTEDDENNHDHERP